MGDKSHLIGSVHGNSRTKETMIHLRNTLSRWLRKARNNSSSCPACETVLPPEGSFCPHCCMVLRPEGMAELHRALQGTKVREDIYILRNLHRGNEEQVFPPGQDSLPHSPSPLASPPREQVPARPAAKGTSLPDHKPKPPSREKKTQGLMTYAFSASPPPYTGPEDLPTFIRWFLNHDPLIPNNLEILEEAHRILYGGQDSWTYERHLAWAIADDLRTYDSPHLLQEHLILLTTVYARTLQVLHKVGSHQPKLQSPADLPESQRQEIWELCLRLGLTATRLRVEGWIYRLRCGEPANV